MASFSRSLLVATVLVAFGLSLFSSSVFAEGDDFDRLETEISNMLHLNMSGDQLEQVRIRLYQLEKMQETWLDFLAYNRSYNLYQLYASSSFNNSVSQPCKVMEPTWAEANLYSATSFWVNVVVILLQSILLAYFGYRVRHLKDKYSSYSVLEQEVHELRRNKAAERLLMDSA